MLLNCFYLNDVKKIVLLSLIFPLIIRWLEKFICVLFLHTIKNTKFLCIYIFFVTWYFKYLPYIYDFIQKMHLALDMARAKRVKKNLDSLPKARIKIIICEVHFFIFNMKHGSVTFYTSNMNTKPNKNIIITYVPTSYM